MLSNIYLTLPSGNHSDTLVFFAVSEQLVRNFVKEMRREGLNDVACGLDPTGQWNDQMGSIMRKIVDVLRHNLPGKSSNNDPFKVRRL